MNSNLNQMYRQLGIGEDVLDFGEQVLSVLRARFDEIDAVFASHTGYQSLSTDGMAIVNVYIRLCSMYPGKVEIRLGRDEELGGARICIAARAEGRDES